MFLSILSKNVKQMDETQVRVFFSCVFHGVFPNFYLKSVFKNTVGINFIYIIFIFIPCLSVSHIKQLEQLERLE